MKFDIERRINLCIFCLCFILNFYTPRKVTKNITVANFFLSSLYGHSVVVDLLIGAVPIGCWFQGLSLSCYALLCVLSSFAFILKRKREMVALLLLCYGCLVTVNVL